jgi:hypothetical protein
MAVKMGMLIFWVADLQVDTVLRGDILLGLKKEAVFSSRMLISTCNFTWYYNPEDSNDAVSLLRFSPWNERLVSTPLKMHELYFREF